MTSLSVAIIGGGPGGLLAAYQLEKRWAYPLSITIYEASNRLGGKVRTGKFTAAEVAYEAGAAELYGYSRHGIDPLSELVADLGLSRSPMEGKSVIVNGNILRSNEDIQHAFGESSWRDLMKFDQFAKDWMTPQQYYESDWDESQADPLRN